jgi:hypothetical protein
MENRDLILDVLNTHCSQEDGWHQHSAAYRLGYLMEIMAEMADKHPYVAAELRDRLNYLKGM